MLKDLLRPARSQASQTTREIVSDLDAIVSQSVSFKLHGKYHEIKPISTKTYMLYVNALSEVFALKDKEKITSDELINKYFLLVKSVCETVEREDIEKMTQAQIGAMFELIMNTITGSAQVEAEKKKTLAQ